MGWSLPVRALGVWVKIPAVEVVEVLAASGVDFVVVDREHGAIDLRTMTAMVAVARGLGLPAFVRVPNHTPEEVQPALDAGADGLFVPREPSRAAASPRWAIGTAAPPRAPATGARSTWPSSCAGAMARSCSSPRSRPRARWRASIT